MMLTMYIYLNIHMNKCIQLKNHVKIYYYVRIQVYVIYIYIYMQIDIKKLTNMHIYIYKSMNESAKRKFKDTLIQ